MSSTVLKFIPLDPTFIPDDDSQQLAVELLERLFPDGSEAEASVYEVVTFIDNGENLETLLCPACKTRLQLFDKKHNELYPDLFDFLSDEVDYDLGDAKTTMPCCKASVSVTALEFDWPAGFAQFELSIWDPEATRPVADAVIAELGAVLRCQLKEIWAHY